MLSKLQRRSNTNVGVHNTTLKRKKAMFLSIENQEKDKNMKVRKTQEREI